MKYNVLRITSLSLILWASVTPAVAAREETTTQPEVYVCANGMSIEVSYFVVRGHKVVEVNFPTGRELGARTKRLLPATQTGSGERYASDITEFHMKGDKAHFATAASAQSEAISPIACNRTIAEQDQAPLTQPAQAGRYFILHPDGPVYNRVETICFAEDGANYFGVSRASKPGQVLTHNGRGTRNAAVSPVDAGVGQRRYTLTSTGQSADAVTLHFIAPGMRETDLPSATSGLSSISQKGDKLGCIENDRLVYVGTNGKHGAIITLEEDGLAFRSFGNGQDITWPAMRQGYVTHGVDSSHFEFLDGENRVRIKVNRNGYLVRDAWSLDMPIAQRSEVPEAFFIADESAFSPDLPSLDQSTLKLLSSLNICNHLAGEVGEDVDRNADLKKKWGEASCETVSADHRNAMRTAEKGSPLHAYLTRHSPNWM